MKTIDAQNQTLGRVATQAAMMLMGKDEADYEPNQIANVKVKVENASKMNITEKRKETKIYTRYTGYSSGLRRENMEKVLADKGYEEVVRRAVKGMLPANKLRSEMLKNLIVTE